MQTATFEPSATPVDLTNGTPLYPANNGTAPMGTGSPSASASYENPTLSSSTESASASASATPHNHYGSGHKLRRRYHF